MTLDEIKDRLQGYNLPVVAEKIGHAHSSVWRIVKGKTARPSHEIVAKLQSFLQEQERAQRGRK